MSVHGTAGARASRRFYERQSKSQGSRRCVLSLPKGDTLCLKQYSQNMSSLTLSGPARTSTITLQEPPQQLMDFDWTLNVRVSQLPGAHGPLYRSPAAILFSSPGRRRHVDDVRLRVCALHGDGASGQGRRLCQE